MSSEPRGLDRAARLQAAAHERKIGQTFLTVGNLQQAKLHFHRAEQLLQFDSRSRAIDPKPEALQPAV